MQNWKRYVPYTVHTVHAILYVILLNLKINELPFYELKYISYDAISQFCIKQNYN